MQFHRIGVLEQSKTRMGIPHKFSLKKYCLDISIDYDVRNDIHIIINIQMYATCILSIAK